MESTISSYYLEQNEPHQVAYFFKAGLTGLLLETIPKAYKHEAQSIFYESCEPTNIQEAMAYAQGGLQYRLHQKQRKVQFVVTTISRKLRTVEETIWQAFLDYQGRTTIFSEPSNRFNYLHIFDTLLDSLLKVSLPLLDTEQSTQRYSKTQALSLKPRTHGGELRHDNDLPPLRYGARAFLVNTGKYLTQTIDTGQGYLDSLFSYGQTLLRRVKGFGPESIDRGKGQYLRHLFSGGNPVSPGTGSGTPITIKQE